MSAKAGIVVIAINSASIDKIASRVPLFSRPRIGFITYHYFRDSYGVAQLDTETFPESRERRETFGKPYEEKPQSDRGLVWSHKIRIERLKATRVIGARDRNAETRLTK